MIEKKIFHGAYFTAFKEPVTDGIMRYILKLGYEHDAVISENLLHINVVAEFHMDELTGDLKNDVLSSKSCYTLQLKNGVTAEELFEVVKSAIDNLKSCPHCNEEDKAEYLSIIPYPALEEERARLSELAALFPSTQ